MSHEIAKEAAAQKALEFVQDGMTLGLGTGSTAMFLIQHLIERSKKGLRIQAVCTSIASEKMALDGNIPLLDINAISTLDLTIDGADEVDPQKRLIKGAGGALVREKIVATMSREMIVICDDSKLVEKLGVHPLPVEILPFGVKATEKHILDLGLQGTWRQTPENVPYVTDNQNWIFDLHFPEPPNDPESIHQSLINLPGVVDTGFFFHLANKCVIGKQDGTTQIL